MKRGVKIYCIGFGRELNPVALTGLTKNTGGEYYQADSVSGIREKFRKIVYDLGGQYSVRWATLKRNTSYFSSSFKVTLGDYSDEYYVSPQYRPTDYESNVKQGKLIFKTYSPVEGNAVAYLNADYVPRYIRKLRLYLHTEKSFTVQLVNQEDGGICWNWQPPTITEDSSTNGKWIEIQSSNPSSIYTAIPYASFGKILRFQFSEVNDAEDILLSDPGISIDNEIYNTTGNQSFQILKTMPESIYNTDNGKGIGTIVINIPKLPNNAKPLEMRLIKAGEFIMGKDRHKVILSKNFYMGKYEITQAQWHAASGNPIPSISNSLDMPMSGINWYHCVQFCNKLSIMHDLMPVYNEIDWTFDITANGFRLPTEAEWEYACRAGTQTPFYWGNDPIPRTEEIEKYANSSTYSTRGIKSVGLLLPNAWGLFDMSGNLAEWCQDFFAGYSLYDQIDPTGAPGGEYRVLRGGSFQDDRSAMYSYHRVQKSPDALDETHGLRLVRSYP